MPPGAAAVLINQSHTYTDLYLPIDEEERQMFDTIDGRRTIADIVRSTWVRQQQWERAYSFFERLWCKINPLGSAYPVWIALLLITLILLFAVALRFEFDISQLG